MQSDRISRARMLAPRALTIAVAAALAGLLAACAVGPDYKRPAAEIPASYKEAAPGWKVAQPADQQDRGDWWSIYEDPQLNALEERLNTANQTVAQFAAAYRQARALVGEA
ncbi:MAG: RND transporter, partial [Paraburkholderia nemoris]